MYIMGTTGGYQRNEVVRLTSLVPILLKTEFAITVKTEISGIEKAEILKGNAALLFGNVAAGGVMNLVTKKPKFDFGGNVALTYGLTEGLLTQVLPDLIEGRLDFAIAVADAADLPYEIVFEPLGPANARLAARGTPAGRGDHLGRAEGCEMGDEPEPRQPRGHAPVVAG